MRKLLGTFLFLLMCARSLLHTICRLPNGCFSPAHLICQSLFIYFRAGLHVCAQPCHNSSNAFTLSIFVYAHNKFTKSKQQPRAVRMHRKQRGGRFIMLSAPRISLSTPCPWGILNRINLAGRELIKAEILCCFPLFFATLQQRTWGI